MFCRKCGAQISEGVAFCPKCGESVVEENGKRTVGGEQIHKPILEKDNQIKKHRITGIVTVIAIVVIVVVFGINIFGGRSAKKTVKKYVEGQMEGNGEELIDLFPKELIAGICEEEGYLNKQEMSEEVEDRLQEQLEQIDEEYGEGWKYSYEIIEAEDYSIEDLRDMRQDYQEEYDIRLDIEEAKEVKIEVTTSSKDGENSTTNTMHVELIKVGNSWYINGI